MKMTGQNILVVGGAAGIGKKIVEDLAEHGGHVAVADLNVEAGQSLVNELREQGKKATFYSIDVCSSSRGGSTTLRSSATTGPSGSPAMICLQISTLSYISFMRHR